MPTYSFSCQKCKNLFEVVMSMANYTSEQSCPSCKSNKVLRDYQSDQVRGFVTTQTVGSLAEKNTSKLSSDKLYNLQQKHTEYRRQPKPELPKGMKRINRENPVNDQPRRKREKRTIQNM